MRVGLTFDLRNPPRWRRPWNELYGQTLDMIEEVEHLGADSIWTTEHHFFEDGYLPQPLTFCAAAAARTRRVRLGTAILIAPLRPAVQIAEEAAIVDLVSDGRLDLGLGPGYRVPEFEAFGADVKKRFSVTFDRVRQIRTMLAEGQITPLPVQDPLPIWLGYRQAAGAYRTGLLGEGLQRADHELLQPYLDGLKAGGHDPESARMVGNLGLVVADDPERAWQEIRPRLSYMWDSYHSYSVEGTGTPVPAPINPDRWRQSIKGRPPRFQVLAPDAAVDFIARSVAGLPVADLSVWASIAGMSGDLTQRHIELFLTQVRPKVRHLGLACPRPSGPAARTRRDPYLPPGDLTAGVARNSAGLRARRDHISSPR